ncbi:hypothetical protein QUF76_12660 [Desulfobacterales bacterium HSG16]|nr:hypothetical protein [Desulfobacterales bacterium HSG16]
MNKSTIAFILVILVVGGYFAYDAELGQSLFISLFSKDKKIVNETTLAFMEDIKFKDFKKAATYHHPDDQEKANIPKLIERLFRIKPELLDIMEYSTLETSLDSSKKRAKVKLTAKVHMLNSDKIKNLEMIIYYHKKGEKWYMELESSLR